MSRFIDTLVMTGLLAASSLAVNGVAFSVTYRTKGNIPDMQGWGMYPRGSLVRYTVTDSRTSSCDTLHSSSQGFAQHPAVNLECTKVAFYRWGCRVSGSTLTNCGDSSRISVVDLAAKIVTDLCNLPNRPVGDMELDWPAGDWIYYTLPLVTTSDDPGSRGNVDIWRVHSVTKQNERYVYINDGRVPMPLVNTSWGAVLSPNLRRFQMNLEGTRAALQGTEWGWNCNQVYCFPPPNGNVKTAGCLIGGAGSCNISLSASGGYCGGYSATAHDRVDMSKLSGAVGPSVSGLNLSDIESWLGHDVGAGGELIRWAENSDKWVLQQIGWYGHAGAIYDGSNQVVANWVDRQAFRTSMNPKVSSDGITYCSCPGDFWVDGGASNAGKYEGADGVWRAVGVTGTKSPGSVPTASDIRNRAAVRRLAVSFDNAAVCRGGMHVYSLGGERIRDPRAAGVVLVIPRELAE